MTSKFFKNSRYSKDNKSRVTVSVILDKKLWEDCLIVVTLMTSLVRFLCIVDCDERLSMEYVYEGMYKVRLAINNYLTTTKDYTNLIRRS